MARFVAGAMLVVACAMKYYAGVVPPLPLDAGLAAPAVAAVIGAEAFLGTWLLFGIRPRMAWYAATGCFAVFLALALRKVLSGSASCGCFGRVEVNPWFTVVLDGALLSALLAFRPARKQVVGAGRPAHGVALLALLGFAGLVAGSFAWAHQRAVAVTAAAARVANDGALSVYGGVTVLEPAHWIGKPFPLLKHVDVGQQLSRGKWLVLIYHHDCTMCRDAIPAYERLAEIGAQNVSLIQMPPFASSSEDPASSASCLRGRLSDDREWFATTPLVVSLSDGNVQSVAFGEAARTPPG